MNRRNLATLGSLVILSTLLPGSMSLASVSVERSGFEETINAVVCLPGGRIVVAEGTRVRVIDGQGRITSLAGHGDYVTSLARSIDGRTLVSGGWDGRVKVLDPDGQSREKTVFSTKAKVLAVAIHPDGREIAIGCDDSRTYLVSLRPGGSGRAVTLKAHSKPVTCLAYSPDGEHLITGGLDDRIVVWKVGSRKKVKKLDARSGGLTSLEFSPRGDGFYTSGKDGRVKVWSFPACRESRSFSDHGGRSVNSLSLSEDGRYLATVGSDASVVIRDVEKDEVIFSEPYPSAGGKSARFARLTAVHFDAEATRLAVGGNEGRFEVLDLLTVPAIQRARALPCQLETRVSISDDLCFNPNRVLDGGESRAEMFIHVVNRGEGPAFDVRLEINCRNPAITVASSVLLGTIPPGGEKEARLPIQVDLDAEDGTAILEVNTRERRKQDAPRVVKEITVRHLDKPSFEIANLLYNDASEKAAGNRDGMPQNGERGELEVYIENTGEGPSLDTRLSLVSVSEGVRRIIEVDDLGRIEPRATRKGVLLIEIPRDYASDRIEYSLRVVDGRGADSLTVSDALSMDRVSPSLAHEIEFPEVIRNGSAVEVTILPKNLGRLEADGVKIRVSSPDSVSLSRSDFIVGKIAPGEAGRPQHLTVTIPTTFRESAFALEVVISQSGFPSVRKRDVIPVALVSPDLQITASLIGGAVKGERARVQVRVSNKGALAANDVVLTVRSDNRDVVLDPDELRIGTIPPGTEETPSVALYIPRGIEEDTVTVTLSVRQRSFPGAEKRLGISLRTSGPIISRVDPDAESRGVPPGVPTPPGGGREMGPILNVQGVPREKTVYENSVSLTVSATDLLGMKQIVVSEGNRKLYDSSRDPEAIGQLGSDPQSLLVEIPISQLRPGLNRIKVSAINVNNISSESMFDIDYQEKADVAPGVENPSDVDVDIPETGSVNGDAIAVIIGNRDYQSIYSVDYAMRDATVMREYLIKVMGFKPGNVHMIKNATLANMQAWFGTRDDWKGNLHNKIKPGLSDVFVYYAGHGAPDPKGFGYIIPSDSDPTQLEKNGYRMKTLYDNLAKLSYRHLTVVIDACFSGGGAKGPIVPRVSSIEPRGISILLSGNAEVFTSSSGKEVSTWYADKRHSLFTYFFLKGLRGEADANGDRRVTVGEMKDYLTDPTKGVPYHSSAINNHSQNPQVKARDDNRVLVDLR